MQNVLSKNLADIRKKDKENLTRRRKTTNCDIII